MRACARWPPHADPVTLAIVPPIRVLLLALLLALPGSCNRLSDVAVEIVLPPEFQADYDANTRGRVLAQFLPDSPNSFVQKIGHLCEPSAEPVRFVANFYADEYPDVVDFVVWVVPVTSDDTPTGCGPIPPVNFTTEHEFDAALPHARGEIAVDIGCNLEEEGRAEVTINPASP
jgi:hypothetical protein